MSGPTVSYEKFLTTNAARISSIESSLRSLTWFLPGRFQDAELASEALYSALNILGLYHDSILIKAADLLPIALKPSPSSHARYTRSWTTACTAYRLPARFLTVISYTELLIEMTARRRLGPEKRWRVVLLLECLKAGLRLRLAAVTTRMVVHPSVPQREMDPSVLDQHQPQLLGSNAAQGEAAAESNSETALVHVNGSETGSSTSNHWVGTRTGLERPTIASLRARGTSPLGLESEGALENLNMGDGKKEVNEYLLSRVLTVEEVKRPEELVRRLDGRVARLAELIWILRPVVYVLAIRKYGRRHTAPFLLSLALEYFSRSLRNSSLFASQPSGYMTEVEKTELSKRQRTFWWYLLRGPVWEGWTKPQLGKTVSALEKVPLLGMFATIVNDYTPLIDEYFYYSS